MRIALFVISFFILATELHAGTAGAVMMQYLMIQNLQQVHQKPAPPSFELQEPVESPPYAAPQTALNDRMFVSVEEYPDGYSGYHCFNIGNFRYTLELCSKHVWECIDGKLFKKTCPGSSVFWFKEEICGEFNYEPTCRYKRGHNRGPGYNRGPNWPLKFVHAARIESSTFDPIMITTDCSKVMSGYFAIKECFPAFINCSTGVLRTRSCPALGGLVFDDRIKNCVSMEACKAPLEGKFRGVQFPTLPWNDEPETRELREKLPEFVPFSVNTDCRKKKFRGYVYEIGKCHRNGVTCKNGLPVIEACPNNLVFSLRKTECIEKNECEETWDQWSENLVRPSNNEFLPVETKEPLSFYRKPEEIALVATVEECVGKKNGRYAMRPCQAEYMNCSSNTGEILKCSEGFVFSRRFLECVGKEFCEE